MTVVDEGRRRRRLSAGLALLVLLGVTLAALVHVAVQARQYELALLLAREQKTHEGLLEQQRRLKSEIARLKDPSRIEALARDELEMGLPAPAAIRVLR